MRLFPGGGHSEIPCLAGSSTFGRSGPQACPSSGKEEKEDRVSEGCRLGIGGVRDWTNLRVNELAEEKEAEMSSLVSGFVAWMRKRTTSTQRRTAPGS